MTTETENRALAARVREVLLAGGLDLACHPYTQEPGAAVSLLQEGEDVETFAADDGRLGEARIARILEVLNAAGDLRAEHDWEVDGFVHVGRA